MPPLEAADLKRILPQRYPFLMIDRVVECEPLKRVVALKNVSYTEAFFAGHFPGTSVFPGVLLVEAMAQASIVLVASARADAPERGTFYLGAVKARFLRPVVPGDQVRIVVEPEKLVSGKGIVKAQAFVGDAEVAGAQITFGFTKEA